MTYRTTGRLWAAVAAAAAALTAVTGCGGESHHGHGSAGAKSAVSNVISGLRKVENNTASTKTALVDGSVALPGRPVIEMKGAVDWTHGYLAGVVTIKRPDGGPGAKCRLGGPDKGTDDTCQALRERLRDDDPVRSARKLLASGELVKVGPQDVRGVAATHYTGTVRGAAIDLWVTSDRLPAKRVEHAGTPDGGYTTTVYYSGFGAKVPAG